MNTFKKVLVVLLLVFCVAALATGCKNSKKCDHDWVERNVPEALISNATCTEPALYYKSCAKCHTVSDELTFEADTAHGHEEVREAIAANLISEANCEQPAYYKAYCSVCNADLGTFAEGTALGHTVVEAATSEYLLYTQSCEKAETYYKSCDRCGMKHDEVFTVGSALGHTPVEAQTEEHLKNAQTCDLPETYYVSCSTCNASLEETFTVGEALGHNIIEQAKNQFLATPKDCTHAATYYKSCEHCGMTTTETFTAGEPQGHNFRQVESAEHMAGTYTCGDTPLYYKVCSRCGEYEVDENGEKVTFEGKVLQHNITEYETVEATHDAHGYEAYKTCSACHKVFDAEGNVIDGVKVLHNYEWVHTADGHGHYMACTVEGCTEPHKEEGEHTYDETGCDVTCNGGCGYEREDQHEDANNDGKCEKCGGDVKADEVPDDGNLDNLTPWMPL